MANLAEELKGYHCHFTWALEDKCYRTIQKLMLYIDTHLHDYPDETPVPAKALKAYLFVSNVKGNTKRPTEALEWLERALHDNKQELDANPEDDGPRGDEVVLLADKAWVLFQHGRASDAKETLRTLESFGNLSDKAEAYLSAHQAFALQWFGPTKFENAIACYKKAFNIYPEKVSWMFADIRLQSKKDDREHDSGGLSPAVKKEEKSLRKLLRLRPNHALARVFLGRCLLKKGSNVEATHHFELAFEQAGENTTVLQRIGEALVRNGYLQQAVGILERVLSINPNSSFALEQLGIVYKKMYFEDKTTNEPLNKALSYFKKAVENDESNFAAKCDIAFTYSLLKKLEEARTMYYDLTQTEDLRDKACAHFNFGKFLEINGDSHEDTMEQYRQAMQADRESLFAADAGKRLLNLLKKRLDQDRNDVDALEFMGWLYETTNHTESACFYYEKAYNLKDSESSLQDLVTKLAHLFLQSENVEKAEEFVNKIRKYDQQAHLEMKGRLHCLKGSIHKIGQDMKQARKEFSRAVGLGSFEGLKNLLEILTSCAEEEIFERVWFEDCAKVMRLLRLKFAECDRGSENEEGRQYQALQTDFKFILSKHEKRLQGLCHRFIEMLSYDVDDIAISKVVDVVLEARNSLDRVMVDFQSHHYPSLNAKKYRCIFFYLQHDEDIEIHLHRTLERHHPKGYQWVGFRVKFPELFDFLVSLQPCKNTDNERLVFLFEIANKHKHRKELSLQEEITIGGHKHQVNLIDLAKWSAITAVNTVRQFTKYMA